MTQSTPLTVTQRSVVGPGALTPQRRTTRDGSPHAAVAWLLVFRSFASPRLSGSASIMGAQAAFAASLAGATSTTGEQALSTSPAAAAAARRRSGRRGPDGRSWGIHPAYPDPGSAEGGRPRRPGNGSRRPGSPGGTAVVGPTR